VGGGELVCADTVCVGTVLKCTGDWPTSLLRLPLGALSSRVSAGPERLGRSLNPWI